MIVFPIGHVAVGVGMTYYCLASFLNTTLVTVSRHDLRVSHGPLPWRGSRRLDARRIRQLYVTSKLKLNNAESPTSMLSYQLCTLDESGRKTTLLPTLTELDEALAMERLIEEKLGLPDERVAGEVAR